ncbi:hypothetical protein CIW47_02055 [Mycolicibacterium sp. P1-5]|nr:hypothetical protein CIW47_02055 [Mycolicibacterium sp. P1-5]
MASRGQTGAQRDIQMRVRRDSDRNPQVIGKLLHNNRGRRLADGDNCADSGDSGALQNTVQCSQELPGHAGVVREAQRLADLAVVRRAVGQRDGSARGVEVAHHDHSVARKAGVDLQGAQRGRRVGEQHRRGLGRGQRRQVPQRITQRVAAARTPVRRNRYSRHGSKPGALGVGQPGERRGQQLFGAVGESVACQRCRIAHAVDEVDPQLIADRDFGGTNDRYRPGTHGDQAGRAHGDTQRFGHPVMITTARRRSHSGAPSRNIAMT